MSKAVKKSEARPFKVPENILMMVIDSKTGEKVNFASKNTIIENYKKKDILNLSGVNVRLNKLNINNTLKFY